jgi:hypothetical protein
MFMKNLILSLSMMTALSASSVWAQTAAPVAPAKAPAATAAPLTAEQQRNQLLNALAGQIADCTITKKPPIGWKGFNVSFDRSGDQMLIRGYVITNNNTPLKVELCDRQKVAQYMIDMLNLTTNNKPGPWQSLLLRMQPNSQFEFAALTASDIDKLLSSDKKTATP